MDALRRRIHALPTRRRLLLAGAYVALLYGTLPVSRGLVLSLKEASLLPGVVTGLYLAVGATITWSMLFLYRIRDIAAYILMSATALVLGYFVLGLDVPEERVHFVQYGLLAVLVCYALRKVAWTRGQRLYAWTFVITTAAGALDEVIQRFLPSRVFDWRDIGFNTVAALLGTIFCWIFRTFMVRT